MNTLRTRVIPLISSILIGFAVSWVSFFAFWFGVWIFHTVPGARACEALGDFILLPARLVYYLLSFGLDADQSPPLVDPMPYIGTNGLILGVILYSGYRGVLHYLASARSARLNGRSAPHVPLEKASVR